MLEDPTPVNDGNAGCPAVVRYGTGRRRSRYAELVEHLARVHRIMVSTETVRKVLHTARISWQAPRLGKAAGTRSSR